MNDNTILIENLIGDHNHDQPNVMTAGVRSATKRDFSVQPVRKSAIIIPLIDPSEYANRIKDMDDAKSSLAHIRMRGNNGKMIDANDQQQTNFCWANSSVKGEELIRAKHGLPYVKLSAMGVACKLQNFANQGAWGALSMDFLVTHGAPTDARWKQGDRNRALDNPDTWKEALNYRVSSYWADMAEQPWDRNLSPNQVDTLLLTRVPVTLDFNWWAHSVLGIKLVNGNALRDTFRAMSGKLMPVNEFDLVWGVNTVMAGYGRMILNSWGNGWGLNGTSVLTGTKAICDGAVAALAV